MDVHDHQDAFTKSYGDNVVASLTCDLVMDNRMVWQEVFMDKNSRPASIHVVWEQKYQPFGSEYVARE